jgi:pilus assembly protein CpaB
MNRTRFLFIGLIALALGALLSSALYRALKTRNEPAGPRGVDVVIAADDIQVGAKVQEKDVKIVKLPGDNLPAGVFHSLKGDASPVGRGVILPLTTGEFILPSKLAAPNAGAGLPALIPPGMRAVSVRVNEVVSVAGFVVPGTRVDVLLTGNPAGAGEQQTTTVLSNVEVLASGQRLERNSAGDTSMAPVITLLLSPEDAQRLTLASSDGRIQLSLRNPLDTSQDRVPAVQQRSLYGAAPVQQIKVKPAGHSQLKAPRVTAPSSYNVELFKGNKKEDVKFDDAGK